MPVLMRPFIDLFAALGMLSSIPTFAAEVHGQVSIAQGPLADATVSLWAAGAGEPRQLAQTRSDADGSLRERRALHEPLWPDGNCHRAERRHLGGGRVR
jgi:hypothetical protein